MKRSGLVAHGG